VGLVPRPWVGSRSHAESAATSAGAGQPSESVCRCNIRSSDTVKCNAKRREGHDLRRERVGLRLAQG